MLAIDILALKSTVYFFPYSLIWGFLPSWPESKLSCILFVLVFFSPNTTAREQRADHALPLADLPRGWLRGSDCRRMWFKQVDQKSLLGATATLTFGPCTGFSVHWASLDTNYGHSTFARERWSFLPRLLFSVAIQGRGSGFFPLFSFCAFFSHSLRNTGIQDKVCD